MGARLTHQVSQRLIRAVADGGQRDARARRLLFMACARRRLLACCVSHNRCCALLRQRVASAVGVYSRFGVNIRVD
jgi:hypothetical protein